MSIHAGEEIIPGMGALPIHSMDPAADEANEADDDTALKSRRRTKRKLADISEDLQDEGGPEDTDWGNAELPSVMGEARGGSAEGGTPAKNGVKKPLPMTGGPKQELLRRCALCRYGTGTAIMDLICVQGRSESFSKRVLCDSADFWSPNPKQCRLRFHTMLAPGNGKPYTPKDIAEEWT